MKSLERRFKEMEVSRNHAHLSSYMHFAKAVRGQKFSCKVILFWFNKLVEKDDYDKRDKKAILDFLGGLSNS